MNQKILSEDFDDLNGKKFYRTTDGSNKSVRLIVDCDKDSILISLKTKGKFKLVLGFYYYTNAKVIKENNVDDISYIPDSEKIICDGFILYKVSNYNIKKCIFRKKNDYNTIMFDYPGFISNGFDILELSEITYNNDFSTITEKEEREIIFVSLKTKTSTYPPILRFHFGIFSSEKIFDSEIIKIKKEMDIHKEIIIDQKIIKDPLRKVIGPVEFETQGKQKLYITRNPNGDFILIPLNSISKQKSLIYEIELNELLIKSSRKKNYNERILKMLISEFDKLIKMVKEN